MPRRHTNAKSLVRAAMLLAACILPPAAAWAARPVPVFQVDVAGQTPPALQQAMRAALVRATGRRESANDPVFAALIADAPKYVRTYDRGPQGELQVLFDGPAVDKAIASADRSVWDPNRPFTLVVLYPAPDQGDQPGDAAELEQAAEERGLPISIVPLPVTDDSGNLLPRQALLEMAHRYGADQLLVGAPPAPESQPTAPAPSAAAPPPANGAPAASAAPPPGAPPGATPPQAVQAPPAAPPAWQWRLYTDFTTQSWSGALTAGIDGTVDLLAPAAGATVANGAGETEVEIEGVSSLADYANIELMLGAVPGVSAANIRQVTGDSILFDLTVRGGGATIDRALTSSSSFTRVSPATPAGGGSGLLVYRYRPG